MQPFLAQSPPVYGNQSSMAAITKNGPSAGVDRPRLNSTASGIEAIRSPQSTIAVLPSSLPDFHAAFMRGRPKESLQEKQTTEQQSASGHRLKPHSRSQTAIDKVYRPEGLTPIQTANKKARPTKWQFGIRSRNQPAEAMLAIFKALKAMGAEWEVAKSRKAEQEEDSDRERSPQDARDYRRSDSQHQYLSESSGSESESSSDDSQGSRHHNTGRSPPSQRGRARRERHGDWDDWGYSIPTDPWVINARFSKNGMYPPGVVHPYSSANSSRADLSTTLHDESNTDPAPLSTGGRPSQPRKRSSTHSSIGSMASMGSTGRTVHSDNASFSGPPAYSRTHSHVHLPPGADLSAEFPSADDSAWVYMTIQLYSIEKEFYLVDFKCAGYERVVRKLVRDIAQPMRRGDERAERGRAYHDEDDDDSDDDSDDDGVNEREVLVGDGRAGWEKKVSSPFPFLDVASRLIIQLAEAE